MGDPATVTGGALSDYDYTLPEGRIALRPSIPRDAAKLLVAPRNEPFTDATVRDLPSFLRPGDRLVVNDSRVIAARLAGERWRGEGPDATCAQVELTLLSQAQDPLGEAQAPLGEARAVRGNAGAAWRAFCKGAKRVAAGDRLRFGEVTGTVLSREGPLVTVRFDGDPLVEGAMPLPPYIAARRAPDARDQADYQTVYAADDGSVAAPTAGLHFTEPLLDALRHRGVGLSRVTLHVGPGTFLPVQSEDIDNHDMHEEWCACDAATAAEIATTRREGGRIVAVGTTALRVLETAAAGGAIAPFEGPTALFVRPGFRFRAVDLLMTNFHLPRSTLLMLVAAFVGFNTMRAIYAHALAHGYRFYSYGDASLLERADA